MYCRKCGKSNDEGARYCAGCGAEMQTKQPAPVRKAGKNKNNKSLKTLGIILLVIVLIISAILAIVIALQKKKEKDFETQIEAGENYLEELEYEKAEASYLAAIEVNPKEEEPYLRLSEIYTAQNKPEKAKEILEQGIEATGSEELEAKRDLYSYVEDELIPEIGQAKTGVYEWDFPAEGARREAKPLDNVSGVITSKIMDFDGDGEDELLVVIMKNDAQTDDFDEEHNAVYLEMYEIEDEEITKTAEMLACDNVLGGRCEEMSGVFLKKHEDVIYICGGDYGISLYEDERDFRSFVVTYEEEEFQKYAGTDYRIQGAYFYGEYEAEAEELADKLDEIDLTKAADDIRSTYMMRMTYDDEVDDLLFEIGSEYAKYPFDRKEDGGTSVIHFWFGTEEKEIEEELPDAELLELINEYGYYEEGEPTHVEGMTGASRLHFRLSEDTVQDKGEYYLVDVKVYEPIKISADIEVGDEVTVVLNELTGETEKWICTEETDYGFTFYLSDNPEEYTERWAVKRDEVDGMLPVYWYSDDAICTLIYEGELAVMKTARDELHITQSTYLVSEESLENIYRNCVYFNEKGYVERMVYYGD